MLLFTFRTKFYHPMFAKALSKIYNDHYNFGSFGSVERLLSRAGQLFALNVSLKSVQSYVRNEQASTLQWSARRRCASNHRYVAKIVATCQTDFGDMQTIFRQTGNIT